jgi:hypothetical protein
LVADVTDVDLEDVESGRTQRLEAGTRQLLVKMGPAVGARFTEGRLG